MSVAEDEPKMAQTYTENAMDISQTDIEKRKWKLMD